MPTDNFWPNFEETEIRNPKTILMEQAALLKEKTKGKIFARVTQSNSSDRISLNFQIVAPTVGNYIFSLFHVQHNLDIYPIMFIHNRIGVELHDEASLIEKMKEVFNSAETIKKISTLMSY